jgi:ribokinase
MSGFDLDVLVAGSLHLDIVVRAPSLPAVDETARGSSWRMICGGKGGNQACWAARLGARTAMISRVGDDDFGRRLMANLERSSVDCRGVSVDPATGSGMSVAILQDDGNYGAVIVSGSNLALNPDEALASFRLIGAPRVVILQNEIGEAINLAVARQAKRIGAFVLLNAAPARPLHADLAACVDMLVLNRVEAEMMSEKSVPNVEAAIAALPKLHHLCETVIVTLGGLGVVAGQAGQKPIVIEAQKVKPVSTHGAGDCFIGQLAQALAQGMSYDEAIILANRTAALYVGGQLTAEGL